MIDYTSNIRKTQLSSGLLKKIFGTDFTEFKGDSEAFREKFFSHHFTLENLHHAFEELSASELAVPHPFKEGQEIVIPGCTVIGDESSNEAAVFMAQTHGNEPVGLSSYLLAQALYNAGLLKGKIFAIVGNIEAARRYWEVFYDNPQAPVHKRSFFRTISASDEPDEAKDLNRLPPKWAALAREDIKLFFDEVLDSEHYIVRRALKIMALVMQPCVRIFFDPHSARQIPDGLRVINVSKNQMQMIERGKFGPLLRGAPEDLRIFPVGLLETLGINEPQTTMKTIVEIARGDNQIPIIGIECGHHENTRDTFPRNMHFVKALLFNMGFTNLKPSNYDGDSGEFYKYYVVGRKPLNYLLGNIVPGDVIYPVKSLKLDKNCYQDTHSLIIPDGAGVKVIDLHQDEAVAELEAAKKNKLDIYSIYQYREMEQVKEGQVVMMGVPSGNKFTLPEDLILFFSGKSSALYGKKPGMWPIIIDEQRDPGNAKFSYAIKKVEKINLIHQEYIPEPAN